jgi:hypothetical protein
MKVVIREVGKREFEFAKSGETLRVYFTWSGNPNSDTREFMADVDTVEGFAIAKYGFLRDELKRLGFYWNPEIKQWTRTKPDYKEIKKKMQRAQAIEDLKNLVDLWKKIRKTDLPTEKAKEFLKEQHYTDEEIEEVIKEVQGEVKVCSNS